MWVVLALKKEAEVEILGRTAILPFSDMAEGCTGCLLAFETKEQAAEYATDGTKIVQIQYT